MAKTTAAASARHVSRPRLSRLPGAETAQESFDNVGGTAVLVVEVMRTMLTQRPTWLREAAIQSVFILRTVTRPVLAVNAIFALSIIGLALGVPLEQLGASDRNAAFLGSALIREFGVMMTGAVFAGVMGTTYTAEFGARKIREELEALQVLGINPISSMVVPRVVAMVVMAPAIFLFGFVAGASGTYIASTRYFGSPGGPFLPQLLSNTSWIDLWAGVLKVALFGFLIAIIACAKGINAKGGAVGVGRAVNESVVACLMAVFFVNIIYTQLLLGFFPDLSVFR
jgi:phospholipid/cholesterol/gamma-HCH transport system permease protein